jgi:hypothetical protein
MVTQDLRDRKFIQVSEYQPSILGGVTGLPDGIYSYQKCHVAILESLEMKKFNGNSWPLVFFAAIIVYFFPFWLVAPRKIWQPCWLK